MKDDHDKLLSALGREAKAQERDESGTLTEEEEKALLLASRPLDADARARIVDKIVEERARSVPRKKVAAWRSRAPMLLGGLALAAAIAFFVVRPKPAGDLPLYMIESSGVASARAPSAPSDRCALHPSASGSFELYVRSNDAVPTAVVAHAFLERGQSIERLAAEVEVSEAGSVRISAPNARLEGARSVVVVVGRSEALDSVDTALTKARGAAASGAGFQVLRCAVD